MYPNSEGEANKQSRQSGRPNEQTETSEVNQKPEREREETAKQKQKTQSHRHSKRVISWAWLESWHQLLPNAFVLMFNLHLAINQMKRPATY